MVNPDFVKLAEAMHVKALRCDSLSDLPAKMKEFMEYDSQKPILLDARVVKNEHVYPMVSFSSYSTHSTMKADDLLFLFQVAAGKALHECLVHPSLKPVETSDLL